MSAYADLVDDMTAELRAIALGVIANEVTHRRNPSFITKKAGREDYFRMCGAQNLYYRVFPLTETSSDHPGHELIKLIDEAHRLSYWF